MPMIFQSRYPDGFQMLWTQESGISFDACHVGDEIHFFARLTEEQYGFAIRQGIKKFDESETHKGTFVLKVKKRIHVIDFSATSKTVKANHLVGYQCLTLVVGTELFAEEILMEWVISGTRPDKLIEKYFGDAFVAG